MLLIPHRSLIEKGGEPVLGGEGGKGKERGPEETSRRKVQFPKEKENWSMTSKFSKFSYLRIGGKK